MVRRALRLFIPVIAIALGCGNAHRPGVDDSASRDARKQLHAKERLESLSIAEPLGHLRGSGTRATSRLLPSLFSPLADRSGHYVIRRSNSAVFFTSTGMTFAVLGRIDELRADTSVWGLRATMVGARDGGLVPEDPQAAVMHSYVGQESSWVTNIPTYGRLALEDIYPGVDMVIEPTRGGVEYRFVLSPGAKVSDLVMRWEGATAIKQTRDGVDIETGIGVLTVRGLRAFAVHGEHVTELPARHAIRGTDVGVEVDGWDGKSTLLIDPVVVWSTYLGGDAYDYGRGIAVDSSGSVVVTGKTAGLGFPTMGSSGIFLPRAPFDAFVTKMSASGALVWSTHAGGEGDDDGTAVAIDAAGNVAATGFTSSKAFPLRGAFDTTPPRDSETDAFVIKFDTTGLAIWSSYLGGEFYRDAGRGVAMDSSGNVFVTGFTSGPDFPGAGGFDSTYSAAGDAFVTKISTTGALLWSSYLGGSGGDEGNAIAIDSGGNTLVTGSTSSSDFPLVGAFDSTHDGQTAFIAKVSGTGSSLIWSSKMRTTGAREGNGVAVDSTGNAFVVGSARVTTSMWSQAFVAKVTASGTLGWAKLVGGAMDDDAHGVAVDAAGNALVAGTTASTDFPTPGGFDTTIGAQDAFVTKFASATGSIVWSSYLGGSGPDWGKGVGVDAVGNVFVTGDTQSKDFPSTAAGFDKSLAGIQDVFITKISPVGLSCTSTADCYGGPCADGVCCDTACIGPCESCRAAKKGTGSDGMCGPIANGSDPDGECPSRSCTAGVVINPQVCNGAGACRSNGTLSCGAYTCDGDSCRKTCTSDDHCASPAVCTGGKCANVVVDAGADTGIAGDDAAPDTETPALEDASGPPTAAPPGTTGADGGCSISSSRSSRERAAAPVLITLAVLGLARRIRSKSEQSLG